jgi:serine/threonine-protein kinase
MADVYLARDSSAAPALNRVVALKRVHRHLVGEPGYREMFLDEARLAFQIAHPNVCSVVDFGEADGEYYLAMEYLVGEPLARLMNRCARAPDALGSRSAACRLARIVADACAGLHAAHNVSDAHGDPLEVVHRDVTPRNLFLLYDGTVKVLDFGIASASTRLHSEGSEDLRGNPSYMAPEQLMGGRVDHRADIWALGVVFWEMLAMKRLFKRDAPRTTVLSVVYDEVRPPSEYRPDIPRELDPIVLKALERNPADRWKSAKEMELATRQVLDTQPVVIGPADLSEWLATVFPLGEARKKQLAEVARRGRRV